MTSDLRYMPTRIEVRAGEIVSFVNDSSEVHTVTATQSELPAGATFFASGGFDGEKAARSDIAAGFIEEGGKYEVTLDEPGTYPYFCVPHEASGMKGTIVVTE